MPVAGPEDGISRGAKEITSESHSGHLETTSGAFLLCGSPFSGPVSPVQLFFVLRSCMFMGSTQSGYCFQGGKPPEQRPLPSKFDQRILV